MTRVIERERYARQDPRLGRNLNHDSRSRLFAFPTEGLTITDVRHDRRVPIFNQGNLGSCTGMAGIGCLATNPFYPTINTEDAYPLTREGAELLYGAATAVDPYPGEWPPEDTGSDGLTIAKVLVSVGSIAGYLHTFSLEDALKALSVQALITGTLWRRDMFHPDSNGLIHPTGYIAGGHEYVMDEYRSDRGWVGFTNSWGDWGLFGRFYMEAEAYGELLAQDGDVTAFVPVTEPAPAPPEPTPDEAYAEVLVPWVGRRHTGNNKAMALAGKAWLTAKELW